MEQSVRWLLTGGVVWGHPEADTVVVNGERIEAIGRASQFESSGDVLRVELGGAAVLPGFVDAHVHVLHFGLEASGWIVSLAGLSYDDCLDRLRDAAGCRAPGEWIYASGWDESRWAEARLLGRETLDRLAPNHPTIAARVDGHVAAVNTAALVELSGRLPEPLVDRRLGHLREEAVIAGTRLIEPGPDEQAGAVAAAAKQFHAEGITSVHTMTRPRRFAPLRETCRRMSLRVAAYASTSGTPPEAGELFPRNDPWFRVAGWKTFADGSIGARNAALCESYRDGGRGALNLSDERLRDWMDEAAEGNWPTAIHAIGDRAIEQVLGAHQAIGRREGLPHRIEHFEFPTDGQIARTVEAGIALCMQPNFVGNWSGPDGLYDRAVGGDRDARCNPYRSLLDAGALLAFGSDGMPVSARYGLQAAVHGPYPAQRVTVEEAIDAYTVAGAKLVGEEGTKGRLAPGLLADLVVVDQDPRQAERLDALRILRTYVSGRRVFPEREAECM